MPNKQGGHKLMNLQTGMVISRNTIWERPITDLVIQAVETMAEEQKVKTLKITGRNKIPIYPANWIAGVEYDAKNRTATTMKNWMTKMTMIESIKMRSMK
jgi:hypothetical protein